MATKMRYPDLPIPTGMASTVAVQITAGQRRNPAKARPRPLRPVARQTRLLVGMYVMILAFGALVISGASAATEGQPAAMPAVTVGARPIPGPLSEYQAQRNGALQQQVQDEREIFQAMGDWLKLRLTP